MKTKKVSKKRIVFIIIVVVLALFAINKRFDAVSVDFKNQGNYKCIVSLPGSLKDGPIRTLCAFGVEDGTSWKIKGINGTLIVDGDGSMADFDKYPPWHNLAYSNLLINDGITSIGNYAFRGSQLTGTYEVPKNITAIGDFAFQFSTLSSISISSEVSYIGEKPFDYCYALQSIYVSEDNSMFSSIEGVLFSKDEKVLVLFPWGKSLTSYTIPDGTTSIGSYAFSGCKLQEVILPRGLQTIGDNAFEYCWELKCVSLPNSVFEVGKYAFQDCIKLTDVELSNSIKTIKEGTFCECRELERITFPTQLESIENNAFDGCGKLKNILLPNSLKSIGDSAFMN